MKNDLTCEVVRDLLPSYVDDKRCKQSGGGTTYKDM